MNQKEMLCQPASCKSNDELAVLIQDGKDPNGELLIQLWNQILPLVAKIANRYRNLAEFDDLMQQGFLGFIEALNKWNVSGEASFTHYAVFWIRQSMCRYVEKEQGIAINKQQSGRKYNQLVDSFKRDLGRLPTDKEICELLEVSESQLATIREANVKRERKSLDAPLTNTDGEEYTLSDMLPSNEDIESFVVDLVQQDEMSKAVHDAVASLSDSRQREAIERRYFHNETINEIADHTGRTYSQAHLSVENGLKELRKPHTANRLRQYWDDGWIYAESMHGCGSGSFQRTWTSSTERIVIQMNDR